MGLIMSKVYTVDYWLPFPSSEYGGLDVFIANSDDEIIQYLKDETDQYFRKQYPTFMEMIEHSVRNAKTLELKDDHPFTFLNSFRT